MPGDRVQACSTFCFSSILHNVNVILHGVTLFRKLIILIMHNYISVEKIAPLLNLTLRVIPSIVSSSRGPDPGTAGLSRGPASERSCPGVPHPGVPRAEKSSVPGSEAPVPGSPAGADSVPGSPPPGSTKP